MKPLCGWIMPEDDARSMVAMIDKTLAELADQPQRRSALRRFQALLEADLAAMAERATRSGA